MNSVGAITKDYIPKGLENITEFENSHNMTEFILKKIKKTHGHFNKDYVMGFSAMEGLRNSPVSFALTNLLLFVLLILHDMIPKKDL